MSCQEGGMVTRNAITYETVDCATALVQRYFESVDTVQLGPEVGDVRLIESNENRFLISLIGRSTSRCLPLPTS